ncbi:alpha/beta fold hydrolase [Candidatus Pacearchaeota archaeon]|nr:alpha/beta fold hydrolase [Candidatus Pacearchaeota archaeon]
MEFDSLAKPINLKSDSTKEFFIIHGYTGSPTDFNGLADYLHRRFKAIITIPRLIGHGETIQSLDNLKYEDFLNQVEEELKKEIKKGREIIIGGISFGAYLAIQLAAKYPVKGLFVISMPSKLRFPINLEITDNLSLIKKYWGKRRGKLNGRTKHHFYYLQNHINGLSIGRYGIKIANESAQLINIPFLLIHSEYSFLGKINDSQKIYNKFKSQKKKFLIINNGYHNPFYSPDRDRIIHSIGDFFDQNKVFNL